MTSTCECCGREYVAKRSTSRFCSDVCRMRSKRGGSAPKLRVVKAGDSPTRKHDSSLLGSVMIELEQMGHLETAGGRIAITLATRLDNPDSTDSGSAVASLTRELRAVLAELASRKVASADPMDELRRRREQRSS